MLFAAFLTLVLSLIIQAVSAAHPHPNHNHNHNAQAPMAAPNAKNVLKGPLAFFSSQPMTGFTRTGYCDVPASDFGNHAVAGEVTEEFLDFSARQGNDLRVVGLKGGCRWCLCASRWLEAFEARKSDTDPVVPRVVLEATHEKALAKLALEDLRKFEKK